VKRVFLPTLIIFFLFLFCEKKTCFCTNPFDDAIKMTQGVLDETKSQKPHIERLEQSTKEIALQMVRADQTQNDIARDTETSFVEAGLKNDQENLAVEAAEKKYACTQRCKKSLICCLCVGCCPVLFDCGCWEKPEILKQLEDESPHDISPAQSSSKALSILEIAAEMRR
jgi:hypothetical protein